MNNVLTKQRTGLLQDRELCHGAHDDVDDLGLLSVLVRYEEDGALVSVKAQRRGQVRYDQMVGERQEDITGRKIRGG